MDPELIKTPIADLMPKPLRANVVNSYLYCAEQTIPKLHFQMLGNRDRLRDGYEVVVSAPHFSGSVKVHMGPGSGRVAIASAGHMNLDIRMWRNANLEIGVGTTINSARIIADFADVRIGRDNLWSDGIIIQSNDQHGIIDATTGEYLNTHRRHIEIGDHVWVGRGGMILPDVKIARGGIVAAAAVLTQDMPENCIYGGNPARKIAENRSWRREPGPPPSP